MSSDYFSIWKERINSNLKKQLDETLVKKVSKAIDSKWNSKKGNKKKWLKACFSAFESELSREESKKVMQACGRLCLMPSVKTSVLSLKKNTKSTEEFVDKVNKELFGEKHLRIEENAIYGRHDFCYCPLVQSFDVDYPEFYCDCRLGWLKELYSEVFGKDVHTEVTSSIIRGDAYCEYKIGY